VSKGARPRSAHAVPAAPSGVPTDPPRLGTVLRFAPKAASQGLKQLLAGGFRVASSGDFRKARAVPNDFDGADVQFFERLGIAIVRRDGERLAPVLKASLDERVLSASRPEARYRALQPLRPEASLEYLRGYRDAVVDLVERLQPQEGAVRAASTRWADASLTWGLQATGVQRVQATGAGIRVAVLDTGFDDQHPDFVGRAVTKKLFTSLSSADDIDGHGTHCVGTACGPRAPAGAPGYGVAHEAEILAGKVIGDDGYGTDRSIIAGIEWALEAGCAVISMSLGAEVELGASPSEDYEQIGRICLDAGTLIVAAAGNSSARPGWIAPVESPANASTIMAVGAIDRDAAVAVFSCGARNPGQDVDLVAPGVDVLSAWPGGGHHVLSGTSMATPHVAGIAALLAQADPGCRGWPLWTRLMQLAQPLPLPARDVGRGLVQAG
jgi:subtilisin family serine protease